MSNVNYREIPSSGNNENDKSKEMMTGITVCACVQACVRLFVDPYPYQFCMCQAENVHVT